MSHVAHTYERVMAHMSHVAYERVMAHMSHIAHTYERVMAHMSHIAHTYERVMAHMSHVAHTYERVMAHMSHIAHTYERIMARAGALLDYVVKGLGMPKEQGGLVAAEALQVCIIYIYICIYIDIPIYL